jgi:uridine phosphorylase
MPTNLSRIAETELILTADKRVYHINLKEEEIADTVILVGDQGRVSEVCKHFSSTDCKNEHREFVSQTGYYNGKRITCLSTGIGTDNIDIVVNELDAAVNIDLENRIEKQTKRKLKLIRLGTSGSLQADIPVNGLVVSEYGIGLDGILAYYEGFDKINENAITEAFIKQTGWNANLPYPYCIKGDEELFKTFSKNNYSGITATAPGFYGPQGRQLRLKAAKPDLNELLTAFNHQGQRISNFEMETSALYGLGKLLGHSCMTVCVIIANRVRKEFTSDYKKSVELLITQCLERLTS